MVVALRRARYPGLGPRSGPWLTGQYGIGLVLVGVFVADPLDSFPVGAPADPGEVTASSGWPGGASARRRRRRGRTDR